MRNSKQVDEQQQDGYFLGGYTTASKKQGFFGDIDGKPVNAVINKKGELSFFDEDGILKSEKKESEHGEFYIVSIYGKEYVASSRFSEEKRKKYVKLNPSKPLEKDTNRPPRQDRKPYENKRSNSYGSKSAPKANGGYKGKSSYNKSAPKPYEGDESF